MRFPIFLALCLLVPIAHADTVSGFCERYGKRLEFSDGIAFADASDEGRVTTKIYLTANKLDRAALAKCAACAGALPKDTFFSPRGDLIAAQRTATAKGWMEIQHFGGQTNKAAIANIMYLADNGTLTGVDDGNGEVSFSTRTDKRVTGKIATEGPKSNTDMSCDIAFDLAVGWPK